MPQNKVFYDTSMKLFRFVTNRLGTIETIGLEKIPQSGGLIVAANHVSHLDPVLTGAQLALSGRRARALAKIALFKHPVLAFVFDKYGHIPVKRDTGEASHALDAAIEAINSGDVIAIYPEGTVPKNGAWLGEFKTGAVRIALATGCPIVPLGQIGCDEILPIHRNGRSVIACFKSAFKTKPHVKIVFGEAYIPIADFKGDRNSREAVLLANKELRDKVAELLHPLKPFWKN